MIKKDVIIIGGGITGLSLAKELGEKDYLILESENEIGGYCKTIKTENFTWDYSGHFFHFKNEDIKKELTSNIECNILEIKKKSKIYYNHSYIDFPFQYNIQQLNKKEFMDCLVDLFFLEKKENFKNFNDFVIGTLGKSISNKFIIPYNEKLYSCNLNELDYDCMGRFFPSMDFESFMKNLKGEEFKSYNDYFIYPEGGAIEFVKSISKNIPKEKIITNEKVIQIDLVGKKLTTNKNEYFFSKLVSTIPFDKLLKITGEEDKNLNYNKVVVFNIGFDYTSDIDYHWVYYPGNEIFYRVGFYNNIFSDNKMSLYVEVGLNKNEVVDEKKLLKKIKKDLKKVGVINKHKIIEYKMLILDPAYVFITKESNKIYDNWTKKWNKNNIFSIGRYGSWTYCSIEDNIIQSKLISKKL
jgi:protoporphyrinogen oxidase